MKAGDITKIYNTTLGGKQVVEGEAKLIKPSDLGNDGLSPGYECWLLEFTDQKGEYFDRVIKV